MTRSPVQCYDLTSACKSILIIELLNTFSQNGGGHSCADVGDIYQIQAFEWCTGCLLASKTCLTIVYLLTTCVQLG